MKRWCLLIVVISGIGTALVFNQPGIDSQLPEYIASLQKRVASLPASAEATALRERIAAHQWFLEQKRTVTHTFPDLTFTDQLTLHLGGREIQVRHHDRAVTPGDAFLYLPKEHVLVTGDRSSCRAMAACCATRCCCEGARTDGVRRV